MEGLGLGQSWQLIVILGLSFIQLGWCAPRILTSPKKYSASTGEQSSVYMECKVANLTRGQTVSWKFVDHSVVIAVGNNITVTHPDKYEIVREVKAGVTGAGSQESWNLVIYKLEPNDKGSYQCTVDGTSLTVTHTLTITDAPAPQPTKRLNETDCCIAQGVEACALPICDLSIHEVKLLQILQTGADCVDSNLFKILQCGGDGRNHEGCCLRTGVSEHCQPLCNYAVKDQEHLSRDYTECIMQGLLIAHCLTEGQANLPSQPISVSAISLGNGFLVKWSPPLENAELVVGYKIQYKQGTETEYTTTAQVQGTMKTVPNLMVDTVYTVRVIAVSDHGASAPSDVVTVATKSQVSNSQRNETIQACCLKRGVSSDCSEFCHADALDTGLHPDRVLPCYAQLDNIFTCLLGADVSPCCNRTRMPEECLPLCSGRHTTVMTSEIQCMRYLPLISACAIEGAHFLPSPPSNTRIVPDSTTHNSTIVEWDPPADNSATSYRVAWKLENTLGNSFTMATVVSGTRHQLTGLRESTLYRVLVVSENDVGSSLPEVTLLFVTKGVSSQVAPEPYNETACCIARGVRPDCLKVCNHTFRVSTPLTEFLSMGLPCLDALQPMLLCGTDERDHSHCCKQAGIPDHCLPICQLTDKTVMVPSTDLVQCFMLKDKLSYCFEEGKAIYPKIPEEVSIKKPDVTSITLSWKAPTGGPNITSYVVEYSTDWQKWTQMSALQTFKTVTGLFSDTGYLLRVYSVSINYTSLPSEIVMGYTLKVSDAGNVSIDWTQVWQNRSHCCENQSLSDTCLDVCKTGDVPPEDCIADVDNIIKCGADGRDHKPCCKRSNVPDQCLPYCQGQSPSSLASQFCPPYIGAIMTCFTNGQGLLPTPAQNFRMTGYTNKNITVAWDTPASNCDNGCTYHGVIWENENQDTMTRLPVTSTGNTFTFPDLKPNTKYQVAVVARNGNGNSLPSTSIVILTRTDPFADITVSSNPNGLIDKGTDVELQCLARSSPFLVTRVQWMRKNSVLAENTVYTLRAVTKDDTGTYSCAVTYENGQTHTKDLWLNIIHIPEAKNPVEDSVMPGINEKAYLKCSFTGFPSMVSWSRGGQAITNMEKYTQWPLRPNYKTGLTLAALEIRDIVEADYGDYSCSGSNKFGKSTAMTLQLTNLVPTVPPLPTVPPNTTVNECCKLEGVSNDCAELCTFTIDIKLINTKPHCITFIPQYIKCGADHRDHTKCCTEKGIAQVCLPICRGEIPDFSQYLELDQCLGRIEDILWCAEDGQKYIPTYPQNVMAVMQYDQMLVSWSKPKENPDKVQSYTVFYQSNEDPKALESHVGASKTSQLIGGVKKGAIYKIQVMAVNDWGTSRKSNETSLRVSSLVPRKPLNLQASVLDDPVDVRVKWSPPLSSVVVTKYLLYYKPNVPGASYTAVTTVDTSVRLEQLKAESEYQMYVRAYSQDGPGEMSDTKSIMTGKPKLIRIRTSPSPQSGGKSKENTVGLAVGLVLAIVLLVAVTVIALFLYRRLGRRKAASENGAVAFENPHYGDQNTGVKISGLPGSSQADNQFGYTTLNEDTDTDHGYGELGTNSSRNSTDEHGHHYDNPLARTSEGPAKLDYPID